jgi:hypothetical protein
MQGIFFDETHNQYELGIAHFLDTAHAAVRSAAEFGLQSMVSWFSHFSSTPHLLVRMGYSGKPRKTIRIRIGTWNPSRYFGFLRRLFSAIAFSGRKEPWRSPRRSNATNQSGSFGYLQDFTTQSQTRLQMRFLHFCTA